MEKTLNNENYENINDKRFASFNNLNAFIISLLILGEVINDFLSFLLKTELIFVKMILFLVFALTYGILYFKYFKSHKFIVKDILMILMMGVVYILYNFFYYNYNHPVFAYFLLVYCIFYIVVQKKINWNYYYIFFLLFVVISLINTIVLGFDGEYQTYKIKYFLIITFLPCLMLMVCLNKNTLKLANIYMISYSIITFVFTFLGYFFGFGINQIGIFSLIGGDHLTTAYPLGSIFIIFLFTIDIKKHRIINVLIISALFLIVFLMLITGARGPIISLLIANILLLFNLKGFKYKFLIISLFLIMIIFTFTDMFTELAEQNIGIVRVEKFITRSEGYETDLNRESSGRINLYDETIKEFEKNIFMGKGIGRNEREGWYPHNSILEILSQTGLIGFIPFILLLIIFIYHYFKFAFTFNDEFNIFKYLLIYTLAGSLFSGSIFMNIPFWSLLIINGYIYSIKNNETVKNERLFF